ncbi:hypothetical protein GCM10009092_17780 [Bowmanella denitrificans]|uniref:Uncharacterized protein n=2 Tax=Bowmanella denitrificans TaxID=366582 RepID=A0ABP3GUD2_9ALTE
MEVLIASFILFISLGTATMVLNGAVIANDKAAQAVVESSSVILLLDRINHELKSQHKQSEAQGNGKFRELDFSWNARVIQEIAPPAAVSDADDKVAAAAVVKTWQVDLNVRLGNRQQSFEYKEISW